LWEGSVVDDDVDVEMMGRRKRGGKEGGGKQHRTHQI
jgi:hypothetical protein